MERTDRDPRRTQVAQRSRTDLQQELALHLETLRDLGPEYTDSVAAALLNEIDGLIESKVQQALAAGGAHRSITLRERQRFVLMILAISIPLLAIAGGIGGLVGLVLVATAVFIMSLVAMTHNF